MATIEFQDLVRSIGVEPTNIVVSRNPLCVRDEIKIEGYLTGVVGVDGKMPVKNIPTFNDFLKEFIKPPKHQFSAKKILKNGDYMTVLWADGTKTIVKRAEDEPESDYAAFTAALGIKAYGSNSALKRIVAGAEVQGKKKKKKQNAGKENNESPFDKVANEIAKAFNEGAVLRALEDIKEGNRAAYKNDNRS